MDFGSLRHTGTANPIVTLEHSDLVPGAGQVVGCDQAIDTSTDERNALRGFVHVEQPSIPCRLLGGKNHSKQAREPVSLLNCFKQGQGTQAVFHLQLFSVCG